MEPNDGLAVGTEVGGFVSPSNVGEDVTGGREGLPEGDDEGLLVVGRKVGCPDGNDVGCDEGCWEGFDVGWLLGCVDGCVEG